MSPRSATALVLATLVGLLSFSPSGRAQAWIATAKPEYAAGYKTANAQNWAEAIQHFERVVSLFQDEGGGKDPERDFSARLFNDLGYCYLRANRFKDAQGVLQQSVERYKLTTNLENGTGNLKMRARAQQSLGRANRELADYRPAEEHYLQGREIFRQIGDTAEIQNTTYFLAELYREMGRLKEAGQELERLSTSGKGDLLLMTRVQHLLGLIREQAGLSREAEDLYIQARDTAQRVISDRAGKTDARSTGEVKEAEIQVGRVESSLGALEEVTGAFKEAESNLNEAIRILSPHGGIALASARNNLGNLYRATKRYDKAREEHIAAFKILKPLLTDDHPSLALTRNHLARVHLERGQDGDVREAARLLNGALDAMGRKLEGHPLKPIIKHNLAVASWVQGQDAQAQSLFQESQQLWKARKDLPALATSQTWLAWMLAARGESAEAASLDAEALASLRQEFFGRLAGRSENEQVDALNRKFRPWLHAALSLPMADPGNEKLAELSAAWAFNGKGMAHAVLLERELLARDEQDRELQTMSLKLREARGALAALSVSLFPVGQEAQRQEQVRRLLKEEDELARAIGLKGGRQGRQNVPVSLAEVRKQVPADGVLVEIAKVQVADYKARKADFVFGESHYVAWVVPPVGAGRVKFVDLGRAAAIDQAVNAVYGPIQLALKKKFGAAEETAMQGELAKLAGKILEPLKGDLASARRWIISPDSNLWRVPWGALPFGDAQYAVQTKTISLVVSGRDVLPGTDRLADGPSVVMYAADYDANPAKAASVRRQDPLKLQDVDELIFSPKEGESVLQELKRMFPRSEPVALDSRKATSSAFLAVKRPRILFLSTHGAFLEENQTFPNPLMRNILLFAGFNSRKKGEDRTLGLCLVTAKEVASMDLRGTDLVVLSACETGVGIIRDGDGVVGLRQAFQLAGARTVVTSLWSVDDLRTSQLMSRYFQALASGKDKAEAMRVAQLEVMDDLKKDPSRLNTHPFFWAAFTVTGHWATARE